MMPLSYGVAEVLPRISGDGIHRSRKISKLGPDLPKNGFV
jgi:hypothetical protein